MAKSAFRRARFRTIFLMASLGRAQLASAFWQTSSRHSEIHQITWIPGYLARGPRPHGRAERAGEPSKMAFPQDSRGLSFLSCAASSPACHWRDAVFYPTPPSRGADPHPRVRGIAARVLIGQEEPAFARRAKAHSSAARAFEEVQTRPPRSPQKALMAAGGVHVGHRHHIFPAQSQSVGQRSPSTPQPARSRPYRPWSSRHQGIRAARPAGRG